MDAKNALMWRPLSLGFDGAEEPVSLVGVDNDLGVDSLPGPTDVGQRVLGEDAGFAGVLHGMVQDHPLARGCTCRRLRVVLGLCDPAQAD